MKPETILLSIIIPVYNVQAYLPATIENVLSQALQNYELILVDDGAADESGKICDRFAEQDSRVRVIHQENAGVSAARNTGVAAARGKYIGFVDSDDLIEPNMFSTMVDIALRQEADIVQCRHNRFASVQGVQPSGEERVLDGEIFVREIFSYKSREYTNQVALWSKIYRRELFEGILFPVGQTYEDEQETYKLCLKANKIVQIPDELYHYVKRENSIITGVSARKILDRQLALLDRLNYLPKILPETQSNCAESFLSYSEFALCQLYQFREEETLQQVLCNVGENRTALGFYMSKYEKAYYLLLRFTCCRRWILGNDFEPIQKIIRRFRHGS